MTNAPEKGIIKGDKEEIKWVTINGNRIPLSESGEKLSSADVKRITAKNELIDAINDGKFDISKVKSDQKKHYYKSEAYKTALNLRGKPPSTLLRTFANDNAVLKLVKLYSTNGEVFKSGDKFVETFTHTEPIGYAHDVNTGEKVLTASGKIHYSKDGVHIVPTILREKG